MKKLVFTFVLLLGLMVSFTSCDDDDDIKITENDLPETARTFLNTHFPAATIVWAEKDNDSYDIRLNNGFEIDFMLDGTWDSVDSNHTVEVPPTVVALVPAGISTYVTQNHQGALITKIDKEHNNSGTLTGYEIDLNNDRREIKFDATGNFIRYDN